MPIITIREQQKTATGFNATLSFDGRVNYPITITEPFSAKDEGLLEWYFKEWLVFPSLNGIKAQQAAASIQDYGQQLFKQVFQVNFDAYSEYRQARGNLGQVQIEIESNTPEFQALHWEAMQDVELPRPLAVDCVMLRKSTKPASVAANMATSPVINLLVVIARPMCILNACQSGMQVSVGQVSRLLVEEGGQDAHPTRDDDAHPTRDDDARETSLGSRLMSAGMQMVVAMGYSVTVTAASLLMEKLFP